MMLPDPFDLTTLSRPDTEIKLFVAEDASGQGGRIELLRALRRAKGSGAQVFHVAEPMLGNVFPRPFPFLSVRPIPVGEVLPDDLSRDGDARRDFFRTIRSVRRESPEDGIDPERRVVGFVFLGFKVLNHDRAKRLDKDWREWTGVGEMLRGLERSGYTCRRLHVWKAVNAKPDLLSYSILAELTGRDGGWRAKDYLQRFRARRMSGYVALYEEWDGRKIDEALRSSESLNATIFDLAAGD